jgi:hypothetical protein
MNVRRTWITGGQTALLLLLTVGLVLFNLDKVWSASVDLAHHFALVYRIAEQWSLSGNDPSLGEMNFYPRLSHIVAALLGSWLNSSFLGMQVVALASLALLWAAVAGLYTTMARNAGVWSCLALALLIALNRVSFRYDLHGSEVALNFFFSQMVAQALAFATMALAAWLDAKGRPLHGLLCIALAIPVVEAAHLLPALELLGMLGVLLVVRLLAPWPARKPALKHVALSLGLFLVSVAGVLLHPSFKAMRTIAKHEGALALKGLNGASSLPVLVAVVLLIALFMLWDGAGRRARRPEREPALEYLGAYGVAIGSLCLLQFLLLALGDGSAYAIRKYGFGLSSFVFIAGGLYLGRLMAARVKAQAGALVQTMALLTVVLAGFELGSRHGKVLDGSDLVRLERQLVALKDGVAPPPPPGKSDVVIDLPGQSMVINYMFSIAVTHTPRQFGEDLLSKDKLDNVAHYSTIFSARVGSRFKDRSCDIGTGGPLLLSDAACTARALRAANVCQGALSLSGTGNVDPSMLTGFSVQELEGRWTAERSATVSCTVEQPPRAVTLALAPFLHGGLKRQRVVVGINGATVATHELVRPGEIEHLRVPIPAVQAGSILTISLTMPDAVTPKELGVGDDGRLLGVSVRGLSFE